MNRNLIDIERKEIVDNILILSKRTEYLLKHLITKQKSKSVAYKWLIELIENIKTETINYKMLE